MQCDLLKIKNKYGEKMSHLCRELFPTLLETKGLLYNLLESRFAPSRFLYDDIVENKLVDKFKDYIYSLVNNECEKIIVEKTPKQLLDEVGYILYECKTEEDIQKFKKYYAKNEELCTFKGNRLKICHVFFAVKKNVDEIKRDNFKKPERQDEYGTSVISIQFSRGTNNTLSIKNRYNHTVSNCDSTFGNNLDNIVFGLTESFKQYYQLNIDSTSKENFEIPNYVKARDGRFYRYNYEINNIYYCLNNIIIDNFDIKKYEKDRYIIFDYFILDMKLKKIELYDKEENDSFLTGLNNINKVQIKKEKDRKYICLNIKGQFVTIGLDKENRIISYQNNVATELGNDFLFYNKSLKTLYLENIKKIGKCFLFLNETLELICTPVLEEIGDKFLYNNFLLKNISMPCLNKIGKDFLYKNQLLNSIYFPVLVEVGENFLYHNVGLKSLELPNLIKVGNSFIEKNRFISEVYMPSLEHAGCSFLGENNVLKSLSLPKLRLVSDCFLYNNRVMETLELPNLEEIGIPYLKFNTCLTNFVIPDDLWNAYIYNGKTYVYNYKIKRGKVVNKTKKLGTR